MPVYWSLCDAALIHLKDDPVFAEVIPSKMFEAMAMGLPLLMVAPAGEATRIVERERAGVTVPAGQPALLAEASLRLLDDEPARRVLAGNALAAAPRYSRQRQAEDMARVLVSVVESGSPGG
jgi:glycosyltransferase involved in cell wall biosynthesis